MSGSRAWQNVTVRLAVALAFADASIVVLALPEIVVRLHTSISQVTWVIMAYNLSLIVSAAAVVPFARRLASTATLVAGLALFGLASLGCGLSDSMSALVPLRCVQGLGGGLLLCASLPLLTGGARSDAALRTWATAGAIGMAVGPAAGGILTQVFDWRAIFLAQAPVAALAVVLILVLRVRPEPAVDQADVRSSELTVATANASLTMLSAGLISALFLVVLVLIDVWRLAPIGAAAVMTSIPLVAALAERAARGRSPLALAALGATLVAFGLFGASLATHREVGWITVTLATVGAGLGLALPSLTTVALGGAGPTAARAAKTVAARDGGIVLGLLILTPVFVHQLDQAPPQALSAATIAVLATPIPPSLDASLVPGLLADYRNTPQGELPDLSPTFARASRHATHPGRVALASLHRQLNSIVERAVTSAFKIPLRYGAIFTLIVLPLVGLCLISDRRTRSRILRAADGTRE